MKNIEEMFETLFQIISSARFLAMEGLGKEVPYFIQTYGIEDQAIVYRKIESLIKRLELAGISIASLGLYDFTLDYFKKNDELEDLFRVEPFTSKKKLQDEMMKMLSPESVVVPELVRRVEDKNAKVAVIWQVGEVYPYIRAHEILLNLQSRLSDRPVIVFFPGDYVTSTKDGFKLRLFGRQEARYYRAFKLEDYIIRGNLHGHA